ncbi:hypothetical protein HYC85_003463 [Camellia sinensis]|uniref:Response regulatory domain-containing protein n=1 Tax=Camellia sinensis TaxID=4442 RepID=A0A7J7HWD5_CAMSI|nr:hypothetical protein HYC85_003463 [Camellia sinensis]
MTLLTWRCLLGWSPRGHRLLGWAILDNISRWELGRASNISIKLSQPVFGVEMLDLTTCCLAREGLNSLRERKDGFDIVISDVNMPDMDVFKLLEHVGLEMDLPVISQYL